jgi:PTH1 family peptidyl-tRNA hydrolase
MKVIIGLGNPGSAYAQTRHNAGALFIEWLIKHKYKPKTTHNTSKYNLFTINENLHLCIPLTFMNLSGQAVHSLTRKYPTLNAKDILVVHDDL